MVKNQPDLDCADPTEIFITEFIEFWEDHWKDSGRYSQSERAMIRAHLYLAVARRYLATDGRELHFTKKELKRAITSAVDVQAAKKTDRDEIVSGRFCTDYIVRRLMNWDRRSEFTSEELVLIRTKLYAFVMDRYRKSGFVDIHFTRKELDGAVGTVEAIRERDKRRAKADERDHTIRRTRRGLGVLADGYEIVVG